MLLGGAQESGDNVSGLSIGLNKGTMGSGNTDLRGTVILTDSSSTMQHRDPRACISRATTVSISCLLWGKMWDLTHKKAL